MIILKILQNYNKDNSWFYLTVRAKLSHLISYSLREDIDRSVLKGPVGMVVAADVKASCWASGLDLGQCNLDHWTKAFDLVEKWNAIGDVHMAGSNKDNLNYCVEDLHFHSEIKFPISEGYMVSKYKYVVLSDSKMCGSFMPKTMMSTKLIAFLRSP